MDGWEKVWAYLAWVSNEKSPAPERAGVEVVPAMSENVAETAVDKHE